jgi:hypothetical protein
MERPKSLEELYEEFQKFSRYEVSPTASLISKERQQAKMKAPARSSTTKAKKV